jgi:hypothetical protein
MELALLSFSPPKPFAVSDLIHVKVRARSLS